MYAHKTRAAFAAVFATAASLALIGTVAPAHAAEMETRSVEVSYADLNLANEAGVSKLNARVKSAANTVCGVRYARGLRELRTVMDCREDVLARAQPQVASVIARESGNQFASRETGKTIGVGR